VSSLLERQLPAFETRWAVVRRLPSGSYCRFARNTQTRSDTRAAFTNREVGLRLASVVAAPDVAASSMSSASIVHDLTARSEWRSTKSSYGPSLVSRPPAQPRFCERYAAQRT
jgi:hypothetical protein